MEENFVERFIVRIDDGRYLMYDSREDVEDEDEVVVVNIPESAANMFESTQHIYYVMQNYFDAQWELMERKRDQQVEKEVKTEQRGDLYRAFAEIVINNELEEIYEPTDED